ncbi:hypothetical protein JOQ06_007656 [Pogonophryne albipinna]|uniref:Uncharacterized protein n=1 Tax=Pogonophryne albipinna TaxID=1090488 RepID=A0AAD6AZB9_9TELE|nr:hypothetical protein JOQ06_007656 [Pogonophryne albipinna]
MDHLHLFKNHRDPSHAKTHAAFPTSLSPSALTYTMGAMSDTERWSKRLKHPDVTPNQLYIRPMTESQQYGWMVSKPRAQWTKVKSFPRKNSEMTKFVNEMSTKDREFIIF